VARFVCSFCEAMAGSLSMASTAVLSTKFAGLQCIADIITALGHCLGVYLTVLCTQFQPLRGSVCNENRILGQGNSSAGETVITCLGFIIL
jgi:hypothetical protein